MYPMAAFLHNRDIICNLWNNNLYFLLHRIEEFSIRLKCQERLLTATILLRRLGN